MSFPKMVELIPECELGSSKVVHFEISEHESNMSAWRRYQYVRPGKYAKLLIDGELFMSDTDHERRTNIAVLNKAHGDVLIAGLGLGMILNPILAKSEVQSVTVIEFNQDVIDLISPFYDNPKLSVIQGDIYEWKPGRGNTFDVIYFDIWANQTTDDLQGMAKLHRRFWRYLNRENPKRWMDSWGKNILKYERSQER